MFIDYYAVLEISNLASENEIKSAFKKQALKWHPDRNKELDTTKKMQVLNEARLILLDPEARQKFDTQYRRFVEFNSSKQNTNRDTPEVNVEHVHTDFVIDDELLQKWTKNARRQAVDLAKQTIDELRSMSKAGVKEGSKAIVNAVIFQIILSVIVIIIISLYRLFN